MKSISRRQFAQLTAAAALAPYPLLRAQEAGGKKLGVALLGLGDYSTHQLAPALQKTRFAKLTGIVTGSPEKVPVWQEKYAIPDTNVYNYENFDSIADNPEIDIVYVVTPTGLHPEFSIRAAKAGKHVICEKPMAPTVEDCTRMIDAAKQNHVTLQIGYRLHWDPYHLRLMEIMKSNEFGPWSSISAANGGRMENFTGLNRWRIGKELGIAGALYDLGVYCVQGQLYTAQELPHSVTARHSTERTEIFTEVPETYEWTLEFAGGRKAEGWASYGKSGNWIRAEVEKGTVELQPSYGYGGQKGTTPDGPMTLDHVPQQALQIDGQAQAILRGEPSRVPGEMGRRDIRVIRGIMEAAATGQSFEFTDFE
ncbi:putative dehydrogenase [Haloferula luteola]|uniref:Putative dehydrogenase n=1 Tax=Haloferula luteola TaxID=595692 RepID=A0A840VDL8_9BACT|nr:Gfo/Idh/MocA family oxidoreductase [Haloferula luteola]MBB5351919.1 putative dehydrogenase [Haloferula luteola]